ncbi:hypothetical protein TorRG33x02_315260 [Trema orientale]|uniref:Uncharacterized protein n=1 Tax=Trema orientale TaxID=63057 RepID=A0A2P5BN28_TREOI|nr:hypothetical protein TorRG33x02_315260 [Trema orientale]
MTRQINGPEDFKFRVVNFEKRLLFGKILVKTKRSVPFGDWKVGEMTRRVRTRGKCMPFGRCHGLNLRSV